MTSKFVFASIIFFLLSRTTRPEEKKNWKNLHSNVNKAKPNENFAWSFSTGPELPLIHNQFDGIPSSELYLWDHNKHEPKHQQGTRYSVKTKISLSEVEQDEPETSRDDDDNDSAGDEDEELEEQIPVTTPQKLIDNYAEYESPRQFQNHPSGKTREKKNKTHEHFETHSTKPNNIANSNQQLPVIQLSTQLQHQVPTRNQTPLMKIAPALLPKTDYEYVIKHIPNTPLTKSTTSTTPKTNNKKRGRPRVQVLPTFTEISTPVPIKQRKLTTTTKSIPTFTVQIAETEFLNSEEIDLNPMSAPEGDFGARIKT